MSWPEALPRKNIGVTTAVAAIAIKSKATRSECRAEIGLEIVVNAWGLAVFRPEPEDIRCGLTSLPRFQATRIQGSWPSSKALALCKLVGSERLANPAAQRIQF